MKRIDRVVKWKAAATVVYALLAWGQTLLFLYFLDRDEAVLAGAAAVAWSLSFLLYAMVMVLLAIRGHGDA